MREPARRWPMFHEVLRRDRLLEAMFTALGISACSAAKLRNGEAIKKARATCIACSRTRDCDTWLDHVNSSSVPEHKRVPPSFCPNACYLAQCLAAANSQEADRHETPSLERG